VTARARKGNRNFGNDEVYIEDNTSPRRRRIENSSVRRWQRGRAVHLAERDCSACFQTCRHQKVFEKPPARPDHRGKRARYRQGPVRCDATSTTTCAGHGRNSCMKDGECLFHRMTRRLQVEAPRHFEAIFGVDLGARQIRCRLPEWILSFTKEDLKDQRTRDRGRSNCLKNALTLARPGQGSRKVSCPGRALGVRMDKCAV